MADGTASSLPSVYPKSMQSQTVVETSVTASSSGRSTPEEQTEEKASRSSRLPPDHDIPRGSEETAYVESVDTSDEDYKSTSDNELYAHNSASAQDADDWKDHPTTPKVPWRKGGAWHVRPPPIIKTVDTKYRMSVGFVSSVGSGGRSQTFSAETDSDSDSSESVREFHPHPYGEEFEDSDDEFEMRAWHEFLHIEPGLDNDQEQDALGPPEEPLYPQGALVQTECYVCFEENELRRRLCCDFPVCDKCLESYLMVQVLQANVNIECLNISCSSYIHRSEISARLPPKFKMKFYKFLIDANVDPTVKTCPRCSNGLQVDKATLKKRKVIKNGLHVTCRRCNLDWCFTCHAPLHKGLTCKEFRKGDILLKDWAREFHYGQLNAQQCPKCKIFIQRSLGCDHMICTRCSTNFCYRCGENYRGIKLLGNHFSRYSPFGCRYNFLPDAPHLRRLIRGAVLGGKLLGGLVLSGFVVAAGACLLGVSVIALPAWGGYKLHKRRRFRQRLRANRKYVKQNLALRNLQAKKANEISVPSFPAPPLDSSDSMADDSSDEMRDRIMVGLELPDAQRVEVLVHQTISSSSDQEEGGTSAEPREVVTDSAIIVTDIQEVVNDDGYNTVVTNVYAKAKNPTHTSTTPTASSADESDEERRSPDERSCSSFQKDGQSSSLLKRNSTSRKESRKQSSNEKKSAEDGDSGSDDKEKLSTCGAKTTENSNDDQQHNLHSKPHKTRDKEKEMGSGQEKKAEEPNIVKEKREKPSDSTEKCDKKQTESDSCTEKKDKEKLSESWEKKPEKDSFPCKPAADQKDIDELSKESTNGCFGNIFSKKISVIQIGSKRNTETQPDAQKPANTGYKSSTWEKSHEKATHHKHKTSMDIQDLSCFKEKRSLELSDIYVKPAYDKGVLLQDSVVLSPPGDFRSQRVRGESDSLSLASASSVGDGGSGKEGERGGEGSSCCCLSASDSFRGSNLSCDIVTYL